MAARTLDALIRKGKESYDFQLEKTVLVASEQRRMALQKGYPDFPSVAEFNARMEKPREARLKAVADAEKLSGDTMSMCKNFVSQIIAQATKDMSSGGAALVPQGRSSSTDEKLAASIEARLDSKMKAEIAKAEAKVEAKLVAKLEGLVDARVSAKLATHTGGSQSKGSVGQPEETVAKTQAAQDAVARLTEENARLSRQVAELMELVKPLDTEVQSAKGAHKRFDAEIGRLSAGAIKQTEQLEGIEAKLTGNDTAWTGIEPAHVKSIVEFLTAEKPKLEKDVEEQKTATASLKRDVQSLQSTPQAGVPRAADTPAPETSTAGAPVQNRGATITFPGDDFESLRNEIGILNQRLGPIETASSTANMVSAHHATTIAQVQTDLKRAFDGHRTLAQVFDEMISKEITAREADSNRLRELETLVQQIQEEGVHSSSPLSDVAATAIATAVASAILAPVSGSNSVHRLPALTPAPDGLVASGPPVSAPAVLDPPTSSANANDTAMASVTSSSALFLPPVPEPETGDLGQGSQAAGLPPAESQLIGGDKAASTITSNIANNIVANAASTASAIQGLTIDVSQLQAKTQASDAEIKKNREEAESQCSALRHMIETLDNRFNNLTTKDMFNAIVGHIERTVPYPRQVEQDLKMVIERIKSVESSIASNGSSNTRVNFSMNGSGKRPSEAEESAAVAALLAKRRKMNGTATALGGAAAATVPSTSAGRNANQDRP